MIIIFKKPTLQYSNYVIIKHFYSLFLCCHKTVHDKMLFYLNLTSNFLDIFNLLSTFIDIRDR